MDVRETSYMYSIAINLDYLCMRQSQYSRLFKWCVSSEMFAPSSPAEAPGMVSHEYALVSEDMSTAIKPSHPQKRSPVSFSFWY